MGVSRCAMLAVVAAAAMASASMGVARAQEPECRTFEQIYTDGKGLCEGMFGDAFEYVPESDPDFALAYSMWFFESQNPNDGVTASRIAAGKHDANYSNTDVCHLDYFHHDAPQSEGNGFTECHPWESNACCKKETVKDATTLKEGYGAEYHWDRCGPLSQECERFFVQEACFYECDVNAGLFRKHAPGGDSNAADFNKWELEKMPIRGDYCDSFFRACREQLFCAEDKGNIFSCARIYEEIDTLGSGSGNGDGDDDDLSSGAIVGIVILSCVVVAAAGCLFNLVRREKAGRPVFAPIEPSADKGSGQQQQQQQQQEPAHDVARV